MKKPEYSILEKNFPITYRADIVGPIIDNILKGESFSFIGMEDNCKSNVARFISFRDDVQKKYMGKLWCKYFFVYIDLNELMTPTISGFYHLIGLSLIEALKNKKINFSFLNNIFIDSPGILLKSLKEDINKIVENTGKKIVLVFNDFDVCTKGIDMDIIARNLTALRNSARYQISYMFIGLRPFAPKHFFFQKIIYMTPFSGNDAVGVVNRNLERYKVSLCYKDILEVIRMSGGHAGTIKFIIQCLSRHQSTNFSKQIPHFYKDSDILFQCERMLSPLTNIEKVKLQSNQKDPLLINLHLQSVGKNGVGPFSPILANYLKVKGHDIKPFVYDFENEEVYYFGNPISKNLSLKELTILKLLIKNEGKILKRNDLIEQIWSSDESPTDWAFDKLISRLRQKIGDKSGIYIKTHKGVGICLDQ